MLRTYQLDAIKLATRGLRTDPDRVQVVSLPTGSGKTLVGLTIVLRFLRRHPTGRVLWLAHRWNLLEETWCKLTKICPRHAQQAGRIGGSGSPLRHLRERSISRFLFTTLQTWHRRFNRKDLPHFLSSGPLLVVVDECHWDANASLGRTLLDQYLERSLILGLSATPRINQQRYRIAFARSFAELCPRFLANPLIHEVETGAVWNPIIENGLIAPRSLTELGNRKGRNQKIVREYLQGYAAGDYTRTLVFACDIDHANELNRLLSRKSVACRAVHSGHSSEENHQSITGFREGKLDALVTVGMLTEGFDVPQIDAVFLARPTASLKLLAQMIGRGARKCSGKDSFFLVEFTDSVNRLGDRLFHAREYVMPPARRQSRTSTGAALRHDQPVDVPQFERLRLPGLEAVPFARDQTFGVEIELDSRSGYVYGEPEWQRTAQQIIARLREAARLPVHGTPLNYHESDDVTKWRVCFDSSCGWEIVSPILVNAEGFAELARVSVGLNHLVEELPDLCINRHTGLHITLATRLNTKKRQQGFAARLTRLEPGLFTLVAPSRLYASSGEWEYSRRGRNRYCPPLRELKSPFENTPFPLLAQCAGRHRSVNLTKAHGRTRLLEIRMHHGTTEFRKIIPWIALWMQIFNRSRYSWRGEPDFGRVFPKGNTEISQAQAEREDIFRLLRGEGIILSREFEDLLRERRQELGQSWSRAVPKRVCSWARNGWYDEEAPTFLQLDDAAAA